MENATENIDESAEQSGSNESDTVTADVLTADNGSVNTTEEPETDTHESLKTAVITDTEESDFYQRGKKKIPLKHYKIGKLEFSNQNAYHFFKYAITLIFLASIRSLTTYVFIVPNGFAPGGVGGISSVIYNIAVLLEPDNKTLLTILDPGITTLVMNLPFIIAAFFVLSKKFAVNTFFVVGCYSAVMFLLGKINFPQFYVFGQPGFQVLAALAGGVCTGFCLGMMLKNNMSMGGTDILGKIIHKHNSAAGAQWWILACDAIVATFSGVLGVIKLDFNTVTGSEALVSILSPILFSFISLVSASLTADVLQSGFQSSIVFNIITDKSDEISKVISEKLHRGVTMSTAIGYYTKSEHKILTCVVSKRQIATVKKIIHECDPLAFTYIVKAHEVAGKGFYSAG